MTNYIFNACNVVINPTLIFQYYNSKFLAWDRYIIEVGKCKNGLWDFGYQTPGSCSPVCFGQFTSFEEAELQAIKYLNDMLSVPFDENKLGSEACKIKAKHAFQKFLASKISQNTDLIKQLNINTTFQLSIF